MRNPVSATCVRVTSWSSPKLITAPSARNKSLNSKDDVPRAAPSDASGTKAVVAVIVDPDNVPPERITVPVASGNVIVRSAVGSVIANVVSLPSAVPPSNVRGLAPCNVAPTVNVSAAASPRTRLPFRVVVPPTVRAPVSVRAAVLNSPLDGLYVSAVSVSGPCSPVAPSTKTTKVVSSVELFATVVNDVALPTLFAANDRLPEASVTNACPEEPSACGNLKVVLADVLP